MELGYRELGEVKKKIQIFKEKFLLPQHGLHDTPFGHYYSGIPACIKDSTIILDKNNKLTELKNKLTPFPKKIKDETIQYYFNDAFFLFRDKLVTAGTRKDTFLFHACVARIIKSLIILTFTLNNVYYPGDKRNNAYLKNFNIIPVGFIDKLNNIYNKFDGTQESYNYTIEILGGLINEYETIVTIQHQNITIKIPNLNAGKKNNTQ